MLKVCFNVPDHQENRLRAIQGVTSYTISELMRRVLDRFLQEEVVNDMIPLVSGRVRFDSCVACSMTSGGN